MTRKTTGATNQKIGAAGQEQGRGALFRAGVELVEHIGTPFTRIPHPNPQIAKQGYCKIVYDEKVSGDHRGVLPGGISVLAEVKTVLIGNLTWSHFNGDHQPESLTKHAETGAISLLVWVS